MRAKKRRRAAEACIGSGIPKDLHGSLLGVRVFVGPFSNMEPRDETGLHYFRAHNVASNLGSAQVFW